MSNNERAQAIIDAVEELLNPRGGINKVSRNDSNAAPYLRDVFFWQTIGTLAAAKEEAAWKAAQAANLLPSDEKLRENVEGEKIVAESEHYSCIVKVSKPRNNFDKETFLATVARKFKVPLQKLLAIYDASMKEGKAPLSKRVLEV
jgi:hypothetical protein